MKQYVVTTKQTTGVNTTSLYLRPENSANEVMYEAGQYIAVGFRRGWQRTPMRCFSATTAPSESGELGIAFRNAGSFTSAFSDLTSGSKVDIAGPFGSFTVSRDETRPLIFLAGGIGITPFMSLLQDLEKRQSKQSVTLLISTNSLQDVPFAPELMELARRNQNYTIRFLTTDVPADRLGHPMIVQGRISDEIIKQFATADTQYYICGPQGYATAVNDMLEAIGVYESAIHNEAFSQSSKMTIAGFAVQKLVYGLLAAAIIAGAGLFVARDLVNAEKDDTSTQNTTTTVDTSTGTTSDDTSTTDSTDATTTDATTDTSTTTTTPTTSSNSSSSTTYSSPTSTMS